MIRKIAEKYGWYPAFSKDNRSEFFEKGSNSVRYWPTTQTVLVVYYDKETDRQYRWYLRNATETNLMSIFEKPFFRLDGSYCDTNRNTELNQRMARLRRDGRMMI